MVVQELKGLTSSEVLLRQQQYGVNVLPEEKPPSDVNIFLSQLKNPLVYILFFAAAVTLLLGDLPDTFIIFIVVLANTILGFYQERKASRAILALKKLVSLSSRVKREGVLQAINAAEIVPGDLVFLTSGEKVPADGTLLECKNFHVNEAVLTGESEPKEKKGNDEILMGGIVVNGQAVMEVVRIGEKTAMGKIAVSLGKKEALTPLEERLRGFSKQLAYLVGLSAFLVFGLGVLTGRSLVEVFTTAVALAVSAVPEGLVISLTVILAIGMQRILKKKVLIRKLLAAETLGSVTVICVDKTGTITEGKLEVVEEEFLDREKAVLASVLANDLEDPLETVRWEYALGQNHFDPQKMVDENPRLDSLQFSPKTRFLASMHENEVYFAGAPELLLSKSNLSEKDKKIWQKKIELSAKKGLRLIGFAWRQRKRGEKKLTAENVLESLVFLGFLAFSDPVRVEVKDALALAQKAGIKVKVITGDYRLTAEKVMSEIGLPITNPAKQILEGEELEKLSDEELRERMEEVILFVRSKPEDKLRIVEALKARGEVVAMTGDGVNDAPALHKADIGIVVSGASEVAKETADMILLDNNFKTIITAIEEGRGIFDNLRKVVLYLLSDAFGSIVLIFASLAAGLPLALTAAQILWINLVSDGLPDLALTVDPKRKGLMAEGPTKPAENLLNMEIKILVLLISLFTGLMVFMIFHFFLGQTGNLAYARSITFAALGVCSLFY
ncbi:MAG: HAD-IC family P-type ATPase, partial [bacterium]|nr:HAD-IC family P-type ATPase [bacterium]